MPVKGTGVTATQLLTAEQQVREISCAVGAEKPCRRPARGTMPTVTDCAPPLLAPVTACSDGRGFGERATYRAIGD